MQNLKIGSDSSDLSLFDFREKRNMQISALESKQLLDKLHFRGNISIIPFESLYINFLHPQSNTDTK